MSTLLKLTAEEYDSMIGKRAFSGLKRRIELIRGELRELNPAGPVQEDYVDFLNRWSTSSTAASECVLRVRSSIDLDESRPEPDLAWLRPGRYSARRPQVADVLLIIEVADSSLTDDLREQAELYAQFMIPEYWVVDASGQRVHIHRNSDGKGYQDIGQFAGDDTIAPACKPSATLSLRELFAD